MSKSKGIELKLKVLPNKPGVYQYIDKNDVIIYVGKAKDLKKRVSSYFNKNLDSGKTRLLVKQIVDINYVVVDTELDALLLENSLIKKYQPKYNIQLKDDKTYPWICIKKEPFARVFTTRRLIKDGSKYFGPYPSVKVVNTLISLIRELYPLRTCNLNLSKNKIAEKKYKVCLEFHIGNCKGPCEGLESIETYNAYIKEIEHIVKGNLGAVIRSLKEIMADHAVNLRFEEAQEVKSKIEIIERYRAKSTVVSPQIHEVDVITVINEEKCAFVNYMVIHNGAIIHAITVEVNKKLDESNADIIAYVLPEMRERYNSQSKEVLVEQAVHFDFDNIKFQVPQKGDKKSLVELSLRNAKYYRLEKLKKDRITNPQQSTERILEQLKKDFRLKDLPTHMECFDNSNFQGTNAVAACVVFKNAKPSKKDYRHFNIKTVEGPDDFASMEEVVYRRYKRLLEEGQALPQLIVIDGGKGQLSAALKSLGKLDLRGKIAIVGIAKKLEEIFFPGDTLPIYLDKRSESLKVIQHMRNEAHRFGISHHRDKRSKASLNSEITNIKGIGPKTYEELIRHFKSVKNIKAAKEQELVELIGKAKAKIVGDHFKSN